MVQGFDALGGIVKAEARGFGSNHTHDKDDIEQIAWEKLWLKKHLLYDEEGKLNFGLAKTIVSNAVTDVVRNNRTRNKFNCKLQHKKMTEEFGVSSIEEMMEKAIISLAPYFQETDSDQYQEMAAVILKSHIREWGDSQGGVAKRLIDEMLEPSPQTLDVWRQMNDKFPTYAKFYFIPPNSLGKILGVGPQKVMDIMGDLRCYLNAVGYEGRV